MMRAANGQRQREDQRNLCDMCGQFGYRGNAVRRDQDGWVLHKTCRSSFHYRNGPHAERTRQGRREREAME